MITDLENQERQIEEVHVPRNFVSAVKLSVGWGIVTALIIGCFVAGLWTLMPTSLLPWGSHKFNLIGYVSHCSFAPLSSLALFGGSLVGIVLAVRMRERNPVGYITISFALLGMLIGMWNGFDTDIFIFGGLSIGLSILLCTLMLMLKQNTAAPILKPKRRE